MQWVGSDAFKHDFQQALGITMLVLEGMEEHFSNFQESLKSAEDHFIKCIKTCHEFLSTTEGSIPIWANFTLKRLSTDN